MIEQTLRIQARPETVRRFFTDPTRLSRWLGPAELDARPTSRPGLRGSR